MVHGGRRAFAENRGRLEAGRRDMTEGLPPVIGYNPSDLLKLHQSG
jgi:hypothetical protein